MKKTTGRLLLGFFVASTVLVVGALVMWFWAVGYPLVDPAPRGHGSYTELDDTFERFRRFCRSGDTVDLPIGYVRLNGLDEDDESAQETWMIYYATASHKTRRGGTIVLMGSDGRIDGYFGHHCSKRDGGPVILGSKGLHFWMGGKFYGKFSQVRDAFDATFKHQRTEQSIVLVSGESDAKSEVLWRPTRINQQAGAGQTAASSEAKSAGNQQPQPESERRSW